MDAREWERILDTLESWDESCKPTFTLSLRDVRQILALLSDAPEPEPTVNELFLVCKLPQPPRGKDQSPNPSTGADAAYMAQRCCTDHATGAGEATERMESRAVQPQAHDPSGSDVSDSTEG